MPEYQVLARKYRPQTFRDVVGQDPIVTTLKNAIKHNRLAHAYLFCGSRGTGKTTIARVFAKALNCQNPTEDLEPCNQCSSCKEIASGHSLDVLEIDGASHRGIDDIRQINENVGYATASGKYKIYLIDEVHMLTKEAFNALLKTLEEPPPKVKFFFATTEPHKVLPTILSRCQRFNLSRIPTQSIIDKLRSISHDLSIHIQEEALRLLAQRADGGLRDAESLLDQVIAFHEGDITTETIASVLGIMSKDHFFELDRAGKEGNIGIAFEIANQVFTQGKDLVHFVESLTEHFRNIMLVKMSGKDAPFLSLSDSERAKYEHSAQLYSQEQCMTILDFLIEAQNQIRFMASGRIALEALLMRIVRSHQRIPIDFLVKRLAELEQRIGATPSLQLQKPTPEPTIPYTPPPPSKPTPTVQVPPPVAPIVIPKSADSMSIDPTPSPADLGIRSKPKEKTPDKPVEKVQPIKPVSPLQQSRYDTILQFAAIELEGTIQKKRT